MSVDNRVLRNGAPSTVARHLLDALAKTTEDVISAHLLESVKNESISPVTFKIWLSIRKTPRTLLHALNQDFSALVRGQAIRQLGRELRGAKWRETWDGVGQISGVVSLLSQFSVSDVRYFTITIGRCGSGVDVEEKREVITRLVRSLHPDLFKKNEDSETQKVLDDRPLNDYAEDLLPGCAATTIDQLWRTSSLDHHTTLFVKHHPDLFRKICVEEILSKSEDRTASTFYLPSLLRHSPPRSSQAPGLSESMLFSLNLLRQLVQSEKATISEKTFIRELVEPLIRRAYRKFKLTREWDRIKEIVDLSLAYIKLHPSAASEVDLNSDFVYYIVRCWSNEEQMFQGQLLTLLQIALKRSKSSIADYHGIFRALVREDQKSLRYKLLRFCFLAQDENSGDIDRIEDLRSIPITNCPPGLFFSLERQDAIALLRRLRKAKPEEEFLTLGERASILYRSPMIDTEYGDASLLLLLLEKNDVSEEWLAGVKKSVDDRRKRSAVSREPTDRAFYANSAIWYAVASGSLDLYEETLLWARRYIRDPLAAKELYSNDRSTLDTTESFKLLSGIPTVISYDLPKDVLRSRLVKANQIIYQVFETACMALKEPSFQRSDWNAPLDLFREVTLLRVERSKEVQKTLNLSDDMTYEVLWKDSLELILKVEKEAMKSENEQLRFRHPYAPFRTSSFDGPYAITDGAPATYRFFDNLAKARNEIWCAYRPTIVPATASLSSPWPRGLGIQFLTDPWEMRAFPPEKLTPYMASRASAIVFQDPDEALAPLPEDDETRLAVGSFIDDYCAALAIYIPPSCEGDEREKRITLAWNHAVGPLSSRRMSNVEAEEYWHPKFTGTLGKKGMPPRKLTTFHKYQPSTQKYQPLPKEVDPSETVEWNPFKPTQPIVPIRNLPPTRLDCSVVEDNRNHSDLAVPFRPMKIPEHGITFLEKKSVRRWAYPTQAYLTEEQLYPTEVQPSPEIREAQIASALLLLDSRIKGPSRLFSAPFPSSFDIRYPSLFLDEDFLLNLDTKEKDARSILARHIASVPPSVLQSLTKSALNAISNNPTDLVEAERIAYSLVTLLGKSDRPQFASSLITQTTIENPDASSWHRQWLSKTFLCRLPASQARETIQSFSSGITAKLKTQSQRPPPTSAGKAATTPSKSLIKITTVKYLAQLLDGGKFVSKRVTVDVLVDIFQNSTHLDIRVAVITAMLNLLLQCPEDVSNPLATQLLTSLKTTIPIAGSLNERRHLTEAEWQASESTQTAPEVYDEGNFATWPPIFEAIARFVKNSTHSAFWRKQIFTTILLPITDASRRNLARWAAIFLAQHGFALSASDLPRIPFRPEALQIVETHPTWTPKKYLDIYHAYVLLNIHPPAALVTLREMILTLPADERKSSQNGNFLHLFNAAPEVWMLQRVNLCSLLKRPWQASEVPDGIEFADVERVVLEQAKAVLQCPEPNFGLWKQFRMKVLDPDLRPLTADNAAGKQAWVENIKPLVEQLVEYIDGLRTEAWQRDPRRVPAYLPSTLELRVLLLPYPSLPSSQGEAERCRVFADSVVGFIEGFAEGKKPYHADFRKVRAAAMMCPREHKLRVACALGDVELEEVDVAGYLRVELADELVRAVAMWKGNDEDAVAKTKEMIEKWAGSEDEVVRMVGVRLEEVVKGWV
ncbi:uncharacterized protein BDZ99DRAFT_392609 [Mytilinidion resinicola]|uniref:Uncharacterized protein n=1 Tax=Mytilinidion resinicola TaxID=574789 RepID=A0A6A6YHD8_9PEZI|nr:uncharacterized protein BDZ99DRAFT_392609 [Mytilinidion resinicola]KAF2807414.1 hypothetical protein BDZ99DRAFT_392609 [Mytilinidion resinicola]